MFCLFSSPFTLLFLISPPSEFWLAHTVTCLSPRPLPGFWSAFPPFHSMVSCHVILTPSTPILTIFYYALFIHHKQSLLAPSTNSYPKSTIGCFLPPLLSSQGSTVSWWFAYIFKWSISSCCSLPSTGMISSFSASSHTHPFLPQQPFTLPHPTISQMIYVQWFTLCKKICF